MNQEIRVRFAPSPTGKLNIGGARTALYNWAFAKKQGGTFILRIEDTDLERSTPENTAQIISSLRWLGLNWDQGPEAGVECGPYLQSERSAIYREVVEQLKAQQRVYPCFCSPEELNDKREAAQEKKEYTGYDRTCRSLSIEQAEARIAAGHPHTWRIKLPLDRETVEFDDLVFGHISIPMKQLDDFIIMRTDGSPTYNFVVCVDDAKMRISHVIRGDDHLSNTPKQIMVYEAMEAPLPVFAHLSMILGSDGKRLSKRHGATSVEAYKDEGYLSDALFNYLALLGWSLDGETTLMNRETIASNFSLDRISKNPAVFDPDKLAWMNQVYLKDMGAAAFVKAWEPYLVAEGLATAQDIKDNASWYEGVYPLVVERIHTLSEVNEKVAYLLSGNTVALDEKSVEKCLKPAGSAEVLGAALAVLENAHLQWNVESVEAALRSIPEQLELKPKIVFQAVRVAICGNMVSLPLFESMELLGASACIQRIKHAQTML
ncbi:MAG: glutamate--tRNA ligase [Coriobacteriales bacterium]|jgi:glutamyl-tRNA synthetase|nr:glutamate--tRNA ligase [Coriobacteriales bacterium]